MLENELLASIEWPGAECLEQLQEPNDHMRECVDTDDWTPLVRLNREFHLKVYDLSPYRLILEAVKRA